MKTNDFFLQKINNDYFILPYGQAAADHKHSVKINEMGAFIWQQLSNGLGNDEIAGLIRGKYEIAAEDKETLIRDVCAFTDFLKSKEILSDFEVTGKDSCTDIFLNKYDTINYSEKSFLNIAGINLCIDCSKEILPDLFDDFYIAGSESIDISVSFCHTPILCKEISNDSVCFNSQALINTEETAIFDCTSHWLIVYNKLEEIREMLISKDCSKVVIYIPEELSPFTGKDLYVALRTPFLLKALSRNMLMIHSASVLYKEKLILFSAPAGTGKSTQAELWNKYMGTPVINGDTNLCEVTENGIFVHGTPWCGTSGICSDKSYPLGAIVFIKRGKENIVAEISEEEAATKLLARCFTPVWDVDLCSQVADLAVNTTKDSKNISFYCLPDKSAVEILAKKI